MSQDATISLYKLGCCAINVPRRSNAIFGVKDASNGLDLLGLKTTGPDSDHLGLDRPTANIGEQADISLKVVTSLARLA